MKSKKLISLLCAVAMTVSSFAGLTISASAAVGDELHKSDFEAVTAKTTEQYDAPVWNDDKTAATTKKVERVKEWEGGWGAANDQSAVYYGSAADAAAYMTDVIGSQKVDNTTVWTDDYATFKAATVTPPAVTGTKSLYFATQIGMNPAAKVLTIAPVIGTSASGIYGVNFDMMLVNADHQHPNFETNKKDRTYTVTLGGVKLSVTNENLSYYDANTAVDTGIDLTLAGTWLHFNLVYDAKNKQFKGKITPYDGDNLVAASEVTIPWAKFNGSAANLTTLSWQNERNDGANKGAANGAIDNFVVEELAETKYNDITVNIKSNGTVIKTYTANEEDGETYTAGAAYKAPFTTEASLAANKYYKYDITSTDSVVSAEGATIDLNFIETDMPTVTFNATVGDSKQLVKTINEIKAVPGDSVSTYLNEYIKGTDNKWYQKDDGRTGGRGDMYEVTVKASEENSVETVNYKPANNVVSFLEAEDSENAAESEDGLAGGTFNTDYIRAYASGGVWAQSTTGSNYPTGFYTEPVAEAGTYEVTVRTHDMKRTAAVAKVAEDGTMTKIGQTTYDSGIGLATAKAELAAGEKIWVGKNEEIGTDDAAASTKLINDVDYIVVKDANKKADTDPVVTFSYANKVASLTSDKDRTVKAVVIHAQYGGGVLTDVKQHPVDILSGDTPTTVNIEEPVYEGDKFMVWETLDGLKPLLVPAYTVPQGSGDAKPKFTVTVADNIANGTVTPDKPQAEQGETVTLTVTPAQGYVLDTLTVKDAENADVTVTNNTFTMPAKNVTVTATFKAKIDGTVTITGTAKVGETLTAAVENLTAGATAKYQWQLSDAADGTFTDVQGATEVTKKLSSVSQDKYVRVVVTADGFDGQLVSNVLGPVGEAAAPITKYAITKVVDPADTATVTTTIGDGQEVTEVTDGINVTVNATATGENVIKEIVVTETDGGAAVTFNAETKTFKMPAKAVTVTVKTAPLFAITKAAAENGTFNVSAEKAAEGTKISVTDITPAEGYKVDTVKFNDTVIEAEGGAYSFTMPAMAVTVTVTFKDAIECSAQAVTVTQTYADGTSSFSEATEPASYGSFKWSGGTIKYYNESWGTSLMLVKFNVKEEAKLKIKSAKVTFNAAAAKNSAKTTILRLTDDSVDTSDLSKLTLANLLDKSAAMIKDAPFSDATTTAAEKSYDFKDDLRANGSSTYIFYTGGQTINVTDFATDIQLADEPLAQANISIQKVYADENGTIEIGNGKYTAFGDADTVTSTLSTLVGDIYTPADTYKTAIDDGTTRYVYVSGVSPVTLAAQNTIYIVYDKTDYQTTTFTAKIGDNAKAGVVVKVKGTPTDTTAAAVDTTVTTGDDGTATIKLLPGTYKYSIDQTAEYLEVAETAVTLGQNNDVALTANSKQGTKITVKYMLSGVADPVKTAEITENVYVGESYTVADSYKNAFTIADETAGTFKRYTYVAEGSSDLTITEPVAENNDITIMVATDGIDYYMYEDYENLDATTEGVVEIGGWKSGNKDRYLVNVANDSTKYINVTAVGNGNNGTTVTNDSPVVAADKDWVMEFDLALDKSNNQAAAFAVKSTTANVLVIQQSPANSETYTINGSTETVTLTAGAMYHYKLEKVDTGVKVTITKVGESTPIVDGVTYANGTATTGEFTTGVGNDGINGMQYNTKRYYSGFKFDNMKVYKPATE